MNDSWGTVFRVCLRKPECPFPYLVHPENTGFHLHRPLLLLGSGDADGQGKKDHFWLVLEGTSILHHRESWRLETRQGAGSRAELLSSWCL